MSTDPRRPLGQLGERVAEAHLVEAGYQVVERNFRTRYGEIDLVVSDTRYLIFCEVKTRFGGASGGPYGPLVSIGGAKRRQLRSMARQWLADRPSSSRRPRCDELRFDAIGIRLRSDGAVLSLEHVEDAF